jgi:hypothetical protein
MEIVQRRAWAVGLLLLAVSVCPPAAGAQASGAPPWRSRLVPWQSRAGQERPWRSDWRLARYVAPGYPDDFQVVFANPDSARGAQHEIMWVRTIAEDPATGLFLGILLNQPRELKSVAEWDNVAFRAGAGGGPPVAAGAPDYGDAGWPAGTRSSVFFPVLREGIRAYRAGNNGHNMPGIVRCIEVLAPAMGAVPAGTSPDERFVGHFVLGRCLAEKYETERAVEQFRAAIALDPGDLDAHMALLAELSIMTHKRPGELPAAEEARWERAFLEQLREVRARFARDERVAQILRMLFDPAHEAELQPDWKPHVAKLRRIGYAVFRWKQR